jgi:putative FmdB family regulatory protein
MPTYDYACKACGHTFEELQSFSEPLLTKCPACKKNKLERLFGGGGAIIFKGSGFYETDYRRAGDAKANGKAEGDAGASEAKTETKAETKADAAPAAASSTDSAGSANGKASGGKAESKGGAKKAK